MDYQTPSNLNNRGDSFSYREKHGHHHDVIERGIWIASSFLIVMLAARFILALLGANPANGFANFIYSFTSPFTAPFYSLFSYDHPTLGISTFEGYTLVAMAVYALAAAGVTRLLTINRYS